jgi:hypothetical protein
MPERDHGPKVQTFAAEIYNDAGTNKNMAGLLTPEPPERVTFPRGQLDKLVTLDHHFTAIAARNGCNAGIA